MQVFVSDIRVGINRPKHCENLQIQYLVYTGQYVVIITPAFNYEHNVAREKEGRKRSPKTDNARSRIQMQISWSLI